jgi:ferredoxin/menaquinone-dependent protoporphyrinogen IX oxidase
MNAIIIWFSPSGSTRKVALQMAEVFSEKFSKTETIDLTRNESYWNSVQFRQNLYGIINQFDVLCIGSPVYAHHLHYNVLDFIRNLLPINGNVQYAVPFVTYGGINSGEALHEAEKLLRKSGRKVVAGIKVNSAHCLAKAFKTDFNRNLPGNSAVPYLTELADKLLHPEHTKFIENGYFLNYQKTPVRIRTKLLIGEKFWHKHMYPASTFDYSKCNGCGVCATKCPLMRIEIKNKQPVLRENAPDCIHCGMCVFSCKTGGVFFNADMVKWEKLFTKATLGKGPLVSNEQPKTNVYYAF